MGERREFFLAATGLDNQQIYADLAAPDDILTSVLQMLADIRLPAILLDTYLDVIAVNAILLRLYDTTFGDLNQQSQQPAGFNLLGLLFSPYFDSQRKQMAQREWNNFAVGNVIYFRRVTLQYRMTDYFATLFAQLRRNREFRWYWEQALYEEKRYFVGGESLEMGSADAGRIQLPDHAHGNADPFWQSGNHHPHPAQRPDCRRLSSTGDGHPGDGTPAILMAGEKTLHR